MPNAFLASFLERWQPSAVASAFAQAVRAGLGPADDSALYRWLLGPPQT